MTAVQTLRAATAQTVSLISARIASQRQAMGSRPVSVSLNQDGSKGEVGLSGGDMNRGLGVWLQGSYTSVEDDNTATAFDGSIMTGLVGIDKKLANDKLMIGLAAGYEMGEFDTTFNTGNLDSDGYIVAPYVSYAINDVFSIDATAGWAHVSYDMDRKDPVTSEKFTGSTDADRFFGSVMGKATKTFKQKIEVTGKLGMSYTTEKRDAFTETGTTGTTVAVASQSTHLGQGVLGVRLGYNAGKVTPYVDLTGEYDFNKSADPTVATNQTKPKYSDYGGRVALGATFNLTNRLSGMLEGNYVFLRDSYTEYGGVAKIRLDF
ncbi:autotransporter outer membrane beta-barrel domain-containing protein [Magnetospira thiophila]